MENDLVPLVIDSGSGMCKSGFAGEDGPRSAFPPIVGCRPENELTGKVTRNKWSYVGDQAQAEDSILTLKHPVERGYITDWEAMEKVWHHAFTNQLHVSTSQHPLLLTETPLNPKASREKATQIMFETFSVPALHVALQPTLCLYDHRFITSVVLDSGDGVTHATAFYEGSPLIHSTIRRDFAGGDLTDLLFKRLRDKGNPFITRGYAHTMKHKLCYVSQRFGDSQMDTQTPNSDYRLPDGCKIGIDDESYLTPEVLFQSEVSGVESMGVHEMIHNCILKCDPDLHQNLRRKVVLAGGTTMIPGFVERLREELSALAPSGLNLTVNAPTERQHSTWIGGSILASLSTFQGLWCSRGEYDEIGPAIVHRRYI